MEFSIDPSLFPEVTVDSIWGAYCDTRTFRVDRIEHGYAICTILTNSYEVQRQLNIAEEDGRPIWNVRDMRGSVTRIRLDRFQPRRDGMPKSNGYFHVSASAEVTDDALAAFLAEEA
jgi:hypothetical protein